MRRLTLALGVLTLLAGPACAQQSPLGSGVGGSLGSSLEGQLSGGIGSGLNASLGAPAPRLFGDPSTRGLLGGGAGCAPSQADPDRRGCRPVEWLRGETPNPNRALVYSGNSAFEQSMAGDPNRIQTYSGDQAFR